MLKNEIDTYKSKIPCMDCGILYPPYVMDFDHRNGKDKLKEVSKLVNNMLSIENIMKEIEKCDLVCANCHRIRTHKRMPSSLAAERPTLDREGEVRIFGGQHE